MYVSEQRGVRRRLEQKSLHFFFAHKANYEIQTNNNSNKQQKLELIKTTRKERKNRKNEVEQLYHGRYICPRQVGKYTAWTWERYIN
mmetsp:Transcript_30514/g.48816  ORF Transcript_30514/g.48816 Transcript_30514/m.48816 type:complete len:87 (+) Transcript_30514:252-512(+)